MAIYRQIFKEFHVLKENFKKFLQLLYAIPTFRSFINENSNVNAMYGVFLVFLFLRPSSHEICAYTGKNGHPVNTAKFFQPIGARINGVPLYFRGNC